jgi:hypothetical protein
MACLSASGTSHWPGESSTPADWNCFDKIRTVEVG